MIIVIIVWQKKEEISKTSQYAGIVAGNRVTIMHDSRTVYH